MAKSRRVHVIKRSDDWVVKKEGASKASRKFETKEDAVKYANGYKESGHDLVIHRKNGTIEKWSKSKK